MGALFSKEAVPWPAPECKGAVCWWQRVRKETKRARAHNKNKSAEYESGETKQKLKPREKARDHKGPGSANFSAISLAERTKTADTQMHARAHPPAVRESLSQKCWPLFHLSLLSPIPPSIRPPAHPPARLRLCEIEFNVWQIMVKPATVHFVMRLSLSQIYTLTHTLTRLCCWRTCN